MKLHLRLVILFITISLLVCCKQTNPVECVDLCFKNQKKEIAPIKNKIIARTLYFDLPLGKEFYPLSYSSGFADSIVKHDKKANMDALFYLPIVNDKKQAALIIPHCISLFNTEYKNYRAYILDVKQPDDIKNSAPSYLRGEPVIIYSSNSNIAIGYTFYQDAGTWVHGTSFYRTFNLNLKTNTQIKFKDYFKVTTSKDTADFLTVFNKKLRFIDCQLTGLEEEGLNFIIRQDSIDFLFSAYEVGAYTQGTPAITLSKAELKGFIKE